MDLISLIKENWTLISQAPWFFVMFTFIVGGGGFAIGRFFLSEKVANLDSRLAARDDRIKELEGRTPAIIPNQNQKSKSERYILIGRLTVKYQDLNKASISTRMQMGLELPPAGWINNELEKLAERWRIRNVQGNDYEIYDL